MAPPAIVALSLSASTSTDSGAPRSLQEAVRHSTVSWQRDLEGLFKHAKDWFPDVVWELGGEVEDSEGMLGEKPPESVDEVWGHKAIVYARAPPSFQSRYFSFRPNMDGYTIDSSVSLGLEPARTPSPFSSPPSITNASTSLLRITTNINPALFSNELEYLYTGQGFGEAFEFLFDTSETRDVHHMLTAGVSSSSSDDEHDAEALRVDKLRKDLVFMWRSRLYSDVRIALTGNFSTSSHDNTTAIFSSHRFILVSRCPYFYDALLNWPSKPPATNAEPPTLTLPSPPFTPASLHFTLGYIYTGTLVFSHRSYDLSTAFAILQAATYLSLPSLHSEVQARIVQEMCHGLFHAFLSFPEYEKITQGRWGTTGCRCRQCARRAPRVLEFSLQNDVQNQPLERGARRALVGMFGEGWCTQEFASLQPKMREGILRGVAKRTTPTNAFPLLFAAEHALVKLGPSIEPWADTIRDMVTSARKVVDECICRESEAVFSSAEWVEILESEGEAEGARFGDVERVEWAMAAVLRGVKDPWAATLYQTLVSAILLRPHPGEETEALLSPTSKVRKVVEETRLELLKWIGKRWINVRGERGFDGLEGWAAKEISDYIEVSIDDLMSPPTSTHPTRTSPARPSKTAKSTLLRPVSQHPHTSRIDADSDIASSMRASVLTRNTTGRSNTGGSSATTGSTVSSTTTGTTGTGARRRTTRGDAGSVRSVRSTATFETSGSGSTVGRSPALRRRVVNGSPSPSTTHLTSDANNADNDSPAKRIAASVRAKHKASSIASSVRSGVSSLRERPDSKLSPDNSVISGRGSIGRSRGKKGAPSVAESESFGGDETEDGYSVYGDGQDGGDGDGKDGEEDEDTESVLGSGVAGDGDADESTSSYADANDDSGIGGVSPVGDGQDDSGDGQRDGDNDGDDDADGDGDSTPANSILSHTTTGTSPSKRPIRGRLSPSLSRTRTPTKKTLLTKVSLSSVNSRSTVSTAASRVKSSGASMRSINTSSTAPSGPAGLRKISGGSSSGVSLSASSRGNRPTSRASTRSTASRHTTTSMSASSRSTLSTLSSRSGTTSSSRPVSRASTLSTSTAGGAGRPVSAVSTNTEGTDRSFRTASAGGTAGGTGTGTGATLTPTAAASRSRKTSAASTVSARSTNANTNAGAGGVRQRTTSTTSAAGDRKRTASAAGTAVEARQRKISTSSVGSVASGKRSPVALRRGGAPPVPPIDRSKLSAGSPSSTAPPRSPVISKSPLSAAAGVKAPSMKGSVSAGGPSTGKKPVHVVERKKSAGALGAGERRGVVAEARERFEGKKVAAIGPPKKDEAKEPVMPAVTVKEEKENLEPQKKQDDMDVDEKVPVVPVQADHRKTTSSASTSSVSSVATVKRRGSVDTITSSRTKGSTGSSSSKPTANTSPSKRAISPPLPPVPIEDEDGDSDVGNTTIHGPTFTHSIRSGAPRGATLDIGIPCIISSKRKRFKAYARYIGEVEGEYGPWVGVEVPLPVGSGGDPWGDRSASSMSMNSNGGYNSMSSSGYGGWPEDDRQWNDGSWGGVRYFEISSGGRDDWAEDRASRRRRIDGGSAGSGAVWGPSASVIGGKGSLKREAPDGIAVSLERMMKRVRSASPAGSESSSMTESRGLFVRPQQVLYVVDAVGADL